VGQQVIVENRPSFLAAQLAAKASPDGYTLFFASGSFGIQPLLQKTPYDPIKDFSPITLATSSFTILVVHPAGPFKSVTDLIAAAKAKPGSLNYAAGTIGGGAHLSAELFKSLAAVDIVRVAYKGTGPSLIALISNEVHMVFGSTPSSMPHVKAGRLRALGISSTKPSALVPDVPPIAAVGVPGYEFVSTDGVFAPAGTPAPIIRRLNQELVRFLNTAKAKEIFFNMGLEIVASSPSESAAMMKSEIARIGKVIKEAGIKAE
jgi:tripartite-type tricarboxylate transporter receptor subunit TctC